MQSDTRGARPVLDAPTRTLAPLVTAVWAAATLVCLGVTISRPAHHLIPWPAWPFIAAGIPIARSWFLLVLIGLVTSALIRGKRAGWGVALLFTIGSLLWSVAGLAGLVPLRLTWGRGAASSVAEALGVVLSLGFGWALWRARAAFRSRMSRGNTLVFIGVLVAGWFTTVLTVRLLVRWRHVETSTTTIRLARISMAWAVGLDDLAYLPRDLRFIPEVAGVMLSGFLLLGLWTFLRSARRALDWTEESEIATRAILQHHGKADSLGWFATRRDKSHIFSPDGQAVVAFRTFGPVLLASGDPLGPRPSWEAAVAAWLQVSRENGWIPAVIGATEEGARCYGAAGLDALVMGDESVIDVDSFTLDTTSRTQLRRAVTRARRAGVMVTVDRQQDLSAAQLAQVAARARDWRHGAERGFSMASGRLCEECDPQTLVVRAFVEEQLVAVLLFAPWGSAGASLDVMRRSTDAPNGTVEFMVAELLGWGKRHGLGRVSLNFAVLRSVFADADRIGASPVDRLNGSMLGFLDRFFQLERLYRSNQKYDPTWVPRFLCFGGASSLPYVLLAAARAEGYLGRRQPPPTTLSAQGLTRIQELSILGEVAEVRVTRSDQTTHRLRHGEQLRAAGIEPYPVGRIGGADLTGRILAKRRHGGVLFLDVDSPDGRHQVLADRERMAHFDELDRFVDAGDQIQVDGTWGTSRTGTRSLVGTSWRMLAKALLPIPAAGLSDPQTRLRQRSLHLLTDPVALDRLRQRSRIVTAVRQFMVQRGFAEVETPILGTTNGGATARPFRTHINAYGTDLVLRIAPELHLKRLVVAGMGPVFEIGRNFRNEGADATHNPEFTALEAYEPGGDYDSMRLLTQDLIRTAGATAHGRAVLPLGEDMVDISGEWPVVPVLSAVSQAVGRDVSLTMPFDELLQVARAHGVDVPRGAGPGTVVEELYAELVESSTTFPTFYVDFPEETSPLTGPHRHTPGLVERWDLVVGGMELATAYSELTDPVEQRRRLTQQSLKAAAGDAEAMELDEDFLAALELGMPPTGGMGIGIDRLVMAVLGTSIRDVLTFPFAKPVEPR